MKNEIEKHFKIEDGEVVRISSGTVQTTDPVKFPRELAKVTSTTGMTRRRIKALLVGETLPDNTPKKLKDAYVWDDKTKTLKNLWGTEIKSKRISLYALSFDIVDYDKKTIGRDKLIELVGGPKELTKSQKMRITHNATSVNIEDYYVVKQVGPLTKLFRLSDNKDVTYTHVTLPKVIFEASGVKAATGGTIINHLINGTQFQDGEVLGSNVQEHFYYVPMGNRRGKRYFTHCPISGKNIAYDLNYGLKVNSDGCVLLQYRDNKFMMVNNYCPVLPEALWEQAAKIDPKNKEGDIQKRLTYTALVHWVISGNLPSARNTTRITEDGPVEVKSGKSGAYGKRHHTNALGLRGVIEDKRTGKYSAYHRRVFLGSFDTKEEAYEAYLLERHMEFGDLTEDTYTTEVHGLRPKRDINRYLADGGQLVYEDTGEEVA